MATLEELQLRVQRLDDIKQIEHLQKIYGYYQDYGEWEQMVDLFTDDGPSVEEADSGVYRGKASVRRYYVDLCGDGPGAPRRPGLMDIVFQLQGVVSVEPGAATARGRWYGMGMQVKPTASRHDGELRQTWLNGIYENTYVKEDGTWKIKDLHFFLTFRTPFEDGWLKVPVVGQHGPDKNVPPDAPPTVYEPYPSPYRVPTSFKNPVTGK
jgi:hypothetical protein